MLDALLEPGSRMLLLNLISTTLLLVAIFVLYQILARAIRRTPWQKIEQRRRWLVMARNAAVLLVLLGAVVIWASELRALAISVVAIAAAVVIATKELILCVSGGLLRTGSRAFGIGDRIEIAGVRGDVIDVNLLTTAILEIGPAQLTHQHTGRAIVLPNALFLASPVINESFTDRYVLHTFVVPIKADEDWQRHESILLQAAGEQVQPFLEDARRHIDQLGKQQGLDTPGVDPRVTLQVAEPERLNLIVRFPAPADRKGRLEQAILRRYLQVRSEQGPGSGI